MDYIEVRFRVPKPSRRHLQFSLGGMFLAITLLSAVMGYNIHRRNQSASVNGKYSVLLQRISVPQDAQGYGPFRDWGYWQGNSYAGHSGLPSGYWVYVAPDWYIWEKAKDEDGRPLSRY